MKLYERKNTTQKAINSLHEFVERFNFSGDITAITTALSFNAVWDCSDDQSTLFRNFNFHLNLRRGELTLLYQDNYNNWREANISYSFRYCNFQEFVNCFEELIKVYIETNMTGRHYDKIICDDIITIDDEESEIADFYETPLSLTWELMKLGKFK